MASIFSTAERNSCGTALLEVGLRSASSQAETLTCTCVRCKRRSNSGQACYRYRDRVMPSRRPFSVTLLMWAVLSLSAWGVIRLLAALRWWDVLYEFKASLSPLYLSITGAGWCVAGGVIIWGTVSGKTWSRLAIPAAVLLWLSEYWIERLFFQSSRANLSFALIVSVLLLVVAFGSAMNRKTKYFLTRSEEHEQPDEHSTSA